MPKIRETMRFLFFFFFAVVIEMGLCKPSAAQRSIAYSSFKRGRAYYHVVTADLKVDAVSAETILAPRLVSVWQMIRSKRPAVAITGTFFNPRAQEPVGDVLVDGELKANGLRGSVLAVDWYGHVKIFDSGYRRHINWFEYRYALRGAVRIVRHGKVSPDPKSQRFHDRRIWGSAARTAVGTTANGKLLLMATSAHVTLSELGRAMRYEGATNAVSLDGGGSTCLYYRGALVVCPKRKLLNLFVLQERSPFGKQTIAHGRPVTVARP